MTNLPASHWERLFSVIIPSYTIYFFQCTEFGNGDESAIAIADRLVVQPRLGVGGTIIVGAGLGIQCG
ncbi:MAG: hypothetical protein RIG63_21610 [Coleofasciculus chthonoplastes F3-SA18-01]|uniref:hypothetical protein n=1 Tax=Coleofasciculus chthonoplastes TaxID=64178 RepID=UPI0032F61F39